MTAQLYCIAHLCCEATSLATGTWPPVPVPAQHCCVACEQPLVQASPQLLPRPFGPALDRPAALLVRASVGTFGSGPLLHVGISSSRDLGVVFNFDEHGCRADPVSAWPECAALAVPAARPPRRRSLDTDPDDELEACTPPVRVAEWDTWDEHLLTFQAAWLCCAGRYDPVTNNCFDYVLGVLRSLGGGLELLTKARLVAGAVHAVVTLCEHRARLEALLTAPPGRTLTHAPLTGFSCVVWHHLNAEVVEKAGGSHRTSREQHERAQCQVCCATLDLGSTSCLALDGPYFIALDVFGV